MQVYANDYTLFVCVCAPDTHMHVPMCSMRVGCVPMCRLISCLADSWSFVRLSLTLSPSGFCCYDDGWGGEPWKGMRICACKAHQVWVRIAVTAHLYDCRSTAVCQMRRSDVKLCGCDMWTAAKCSVWAHHTSGCVEGLDVARCSLHLTPCVGEAACQKVPTNPTHYSHLTCLGTYSSPDYVQFGAEVTLCTASVKNSQSPGHRAESTRDVRADWGQEERLHIHTAQQAAQLCLLCSSQASWLALPQLPYGITIAFNLLCVLSHLGLNGCLVYPSTEVWASLLHSLFYFL